MSRCATQGSGGLLSILCLIALSACSASSQASAMEEQERDTVRQLFAEGFDGAPAGQGSPSARSSLLGYDASPRLRREIAAEMADSLNRNFSLRFAMPDPELFLRSGEAAQVGQRSLEALGLPVDTVGGGTVLLFGLAWELANDETMTPAQQSALLQQVGASFTDNPLTEGDDEARQRQGDALLLTAALWLEEARLRRRDPEAMQALSDAVWRDMKRMSDNDMRAHRIGDTGFVER